MGNELVLTSVIRSSKLVGNATNDMYIVTLPCSIEIDGKYDYPNPKSEVEPFLT